MSVRVIFECDHDGCDVVLDAKASACERGGTWGPEIHTAEQRPRVATAGWHVEYGKILCPAHVSDLLPKPIASYLGVDCFEPDDDWVDDD